MIPPVAVSYTHLATQRTYPSWGYMAENGATTIWELWNGDKADPKMNSGNHVMLLGDLLTWCYQYLGGIQQKGCLLYTSWNLFRCRTQHLRKLLGQRRNGKRCRS